MGLIGMLLTVLGALALLPSTLLLLQVLLALPAQRARAMPAARRPSVAVVVPAHDEAHSIRATLSAVAAQLSAADRLLVVADNCSDDTAAIAAAAGAEVIERRDSARRGKGFALDFALRHLERDPAEVVLVVDADCDVGDGAIERLARACLASGRPAQALYRMRSAGGASLAELAWIVKNQVRPLGYRRLGLPCQLMGSGMAFPWPVIRSARLASAELVEDLALGLELARAGAAPLFCPEAQVTSVFPATTEGARTQRRRWEHGHLALMAREAPRLFLQGIRTRNASLLALLIDLCVPPLALLTILVLALLAAGALYFTVTGIALPLLIAAASLAMLGVAVLAAWTRYGRRVLPLAALRHAPRYAFSKLPLYLGFLRRRQAHWVRTRRGE